MRPLEIKQHSFRLRFYNKDNTMKSATKELTITCENSDSYFGLTHVI